LFTTSTQITPADSSTCSKTPGFPPQAPNYTSWLEGSLALWTDNRTKKDQNYFEFDDFILETPPGTEVFIDVSPEIGHHALKTYLVMHQGQKLGWILKYQELEFAKLASDLPTQGTWGANTLTMGDTLTSGYAQKFLKQVFFFVPNLKLEKSEFDYMYLERIRFLEL
jgi:hypothetical protein